MQIELRVESCADHCDDGAAGIWAATRLLGEIRYLEDPMARAELFTKAQVLLTAFVLGLEPLNSDRTISASPRAGLGCA